MIKYFIILVLLTWFGWGPIVSDTFRINFLKHFFNQNSVECWQVTILATPAICLISQKYRQMPWGQKIIIGLLIAGLVICIDFFIIISAGWLGF